MRSKFDVMSSRSVILLMYDAELTMNEMLRKTVRDRKTGEGFVAELMVTVPYREWNEIVRYVDGKGKMPRFDYSRRNIMLRSSGRRVQLLWKFAMEKNKLPHDHAPLTIELHDNPYLSGRIRIEPSKLSLRESQEPFRDEPARSSHHQNSLNHSSANGAAKQ